MRYSWWITLKDWQPCLEPFRKNDVQEELLMTTETAEIETTADDFNNDQVLTIAAGHTIHDV